MSTMLVFPRLDQRSLRKYVELYRQPRFRSLQEALSEVADSPVAPDRISHNSVGTNRVSEDELEKHRTSLTEIAEKYGYPATPKEFSAYDRETSKYLTNSLHIYPSDAGEQDVWAHFNAWLVPHLVLWRWPLSSETVSSSDLQGFERFGLGSRWFHRNQMGRLWWRGYLLGETYWSTSIGEDQLTAILERPSIGRNPRLAGAIAEAWLPYKNAANSEALMRDVVQRIRLLLPVYSLNSLDLRAITEHVGMAFDESISFLAKNSRT